VLEHRRNGWYVLGGGMIAAGATWLASWGVAVASTSQSLDFWAPGSYVATGVTAAGAFIVLQVMYDWIARLPFRRVSTTSTLPLKVTPGKPHFHDWNYAASVALLPVTVSNTTGEPVTLAGGCQMRGNSGGTPDWRDRLLDGEKSAFLQEVESQTRSSHHRPNITERTTIPAHSSLELWYVTEISRDQRGIYLNMVLYFKDTEGNQYFAAFRPREARPGFEIV
jgi:hypothetical protein